MSDGPRISVRQAVEPVAAGAAEELAGRGLNSSYRVVRGGLSYAVKVHCAEHSSETEARRIRSVDVALRGAPWYPPVLDLGTVRMAGRPRLVVVRPYVPGVPAQDARTHIPEVVAVLGELAARAGGPAAGAVAEELVGDYATPWTDDAGRERAATARLLTGEWRELGRTVDRRLDELSASAVRLTRADATVLHHGDLHGRNLIADGPGRLTVIDWDEAGLSRRPADAGKALWLSCRLGRGDFVLDPGAVRSYLGLLHSRLGIPYATAPELARLGALWFLPRHRHVELLAGRDPALAPWYLGWVGRFWARFGRNLELIAGVAAEGPEPGSGSAEYPVAGGPESG
ncbi:aminoglycoside phosphotransferase family protein [Streptomyces sp. LP05-1]|uniref:Aminoglycoside phosphotransferase family protein n=1 Tax=Streptomyces pyxinae TaxID=2970734 RepID=A0ABT2CEG5_9ACTN|nr:aminoglycoside phosphotransferase family protein [Streptomyces sp. LP05-1]MCS0635797.1 aminoglycoside phosphotransferase family protein [Streptomyces sp. LP05-1]